MKSCFEIAIATLLFSVVGIVAQARPALVHQSGEVHYVNDCKQNASGNWVYQQIANGPWTYMPSDVVCSDGSSAVGGNVTGSVLVSDGKKVRKKVAQPSQGIGDLNSSRSNRTGN